MNVFEEIKDLKEKFDKVFEVSSEEDLDPQSGDISPNKISRKKKEKGKKEPVEVVSVADELFPYEGTAKEQLNQKILAKINDMLQGTATLEDLINLVRSGKKLKESLNNPKSLEDALNIAEGMLENLNETLNK